MITGNGKPLSGRPRQNKDTVLKELKANHPRVFNWLSTMKSSGLFLSETGFKNVANRFRISVEELKQIIDVFEKGAGNG
jgi:hypothetical protein